MTSAMSSRRRLVKVCDAATTADWGQQEEAVLAVAAEQQRAQPPAAELAALSSPKTNTFGEIAALSVPALGAQKPVQCRVAA